MSYSENPQGEYFEFEVKKCEQVKEDICEKVDEEGDDQFCEIIDQVTSENGEIKDEFCEKSINLHLSSALIKSGLLNMRELNPGQDQKIKVGKVFIFISVLKNGFCQEIMAIYKDQHLSTQAERQLLHSIIFESDPGA